ncbi:MAG: mechanosensitive ion channel family protein [Candidatus Bipolaricaulota bacterium]
MLRGVLAEDGRVLAEPASQVLVTELGKSSVNLLVRGWVRRMDEGAFAIMRAELTRRAREALDAAGIEIPFPQRVVHLKQSAPSNASPH